MLFLFDQTYSEYDILMFLRFLSNHDNVYTQFAAPVATEAPIHHHCRVAHIPGIEEPQSRSIFAWEIRRQRSNLGLGCSPRVQL